MRHEWVFDVLSDLLAYATRNDLPRLAAKVSEAIDDARREIDARAEVQEEQPAATKTDRQMH